MSVVPGAASLPTAVRLGTLVLPHPVVAASGCFGYASELQGVVDFDWLGGVATKGISLAPKEGNAPPRIVEVRGGLLNSIGLQNVGLEAFVRDKMPFLRAIPSAVLVNIYGRTLEEYVALARALDGVPGVDALELNLSCPNVAEGGIEFGTTPEAVARLVGAVRAVTRLPVVPKLSPNVTAIVSLAKAALDAGANALSLVNTLRGASFDPRLGRPVLATTYGGLSGPALKPVALAMVHAVWRATRAPILGGGGVMCAGDAREFLDAGATAIQVGTAHFLDPRAGERIARALAASLDKATRT